MLVFLNSLQQKGFQGITKHLIMVLPPYVSVIIRDVHLDNQSRFAVRNGKKQLLSSYWFEEQGTYEGPEGFQTDSKESKLLPRSSRISLVPFRTFRRPLFPKPVTGKELFFAVSYSKAALNSSYCCAAPSSSSNLWKGLVN